VVVRPDGSAALILKPRRRAIRLGVLGALVGVTAIGLLVADWIELRRSLIDSEAFAQRITYEEQQNGRLRAAIAAVRGELEGWAKLEAAIAAPLDRVPTQRPASTTDSDDAEEMLQRVRHGTAALKDTAALMTRLRDTVAPLPTKWPLRTAINSHFGMRKDPVTGEPEFHQGIDLAAKTGSPVHAPASGNVVFAGHDGGYGLSVKVQHAPELHTRYGHLSKLTVRAGDFVQRGHVLGHAGNTGRSTGTHLHYEVVVAGRAVNPKAFLWD
jgi:murein DD-endopeptidase MepM/ murein hydrolase activator NlpD